MKIIFGFSSSFKRKIDFFAYPFVARFKVYYKMPKLLSL